jgi:two-component sensor histidine kinase
MQSKDQTSPERLRRQQRALAEFGLRAFRSHDLDATLHEACVLVGEGLEAKLTKVLELLPGSREFLIRAGINWKPGVVGVVRLGADSASPAGYALERDEPVVSHDLAGETRFEIPPVLVEHGVQSMVNVIIASEEGAFGVLEVDVPEHREFDEDDIAFMKNCANLLAAAIDRHRVHVALEEAASEQRLLAQELAHRVKNTLALVHALVAQTLADEPVARELRDSLLGRLQALSRAEDLLFQDHARHLDLAELARRALEPFDSAASRIALEGHRFILPARSGRILALILHELATNATRHGALSAPEGTVRLDWATETSGEGTRVRLRWTESGGPPVEPPKRRGFGTRLLTTLAEYELDGKVELDLRRSGLCYGLVFPDESQ